MGWGRALTPPRMQDASAARGRSWGAPCWPRGLCFDGLDERWRDATKGQCPDAGNILRKCEQLPRHAKLWSAPVLDRYPGGVLRVPIATGASQVGTFKRLLGNESAYLRVA